MPFPYCYITLTSEEREKISRELKRLLLAGKHNKRKPLQALWLSDQKKTFRNIANYLEKSYFTICKWVYRYRKDGLDGFIRWLNRSDFGKGRSV